ncbi:hypothetical protein ACWC1D_18600 [Streptomyces sp. NPDC001478]
MTSPAGGQHPVDERQASGREALVMHPRGKQIAVHHVLGEPNRPPCGRRPSTTGPVTWD